MQEIFKFCKVFQATKKDNSKKHDFGFSLLHRYKHNAILETTGWRHTIAFAMNTLKTGRIAFIFFEVTS